MEKGGLKRIISTYQAQTPVGNKTGHPVYIAIQLGLFKISNLGTELLFTIEQLHSYWKTWRERIYPHYLSAPVIGPKQESFLMDAS